MPPSTTRNLFVQIGGSASDLTIATKAGKSALLELGDTADGVQATFRASFEKMGGTVADQAKAMEDAYSRSFANIRATAQAALRAPTPSAQGIVINLSAAKQEAEQAQAAATYLRTLSDAQARLVDSGQEASAGARSLAVSLEAQAVSAENAALASKEAVLGLQRLAAESGIAANDLDEVAGAHTRMGASGLIAEHVVRSFSDSITAGQSPIRAFALEIPRVTEAMQFFAMETGATEGAVGTFAKFMGGPWGLAITLGTSLLAPLIANLFETKDAVNDAGSAEKQYAKDQDSFADAIDKANGKLVERNRLLSAIALQEKAPDIQKQESAARGFASQAFDRARAVANPQLYGSATQQAGVAGLDAASVSNPAVQKAVDSANGNVVKLRDNLDALAKQASGNDKVALRALADEVNHLAGQSVEAAKQAETLKGKASEVATALRGGTVLTTEGVQRSIEEKNASTPLERAQIKVRELTDQKADLDKTPYSPAQQAAVKKWGAELDAATAAVKRLEAAQKEATSGRQVGRQIDLSQAEDIVHSIGGRVTSAQRSTAEQSVLYDRYKAGTGSLAAKPGTSLHETGQALDVAKTAGVSLASLKKAFEDAGVHLTEALDEGNHYHVGFGRKGPSADTLARRQQTAERSAANNDNSFQNELRAALDGYASEQAKLPQTPDQRYATDTGKAQDDFIQRSAGIEDEVAAGKRTAAEGNQLVAILYLTEQLQEQGATLKRDTDNTNEQYDLGVAALNARQDLARLDAQIAPTRVARLAVEKQILAAEQQAYRDQLNRDVANAKSNPEAAKKAGIALQSIDQREAKQNSALGKQYASPLQSYKDQLSQSVGDTSDALQGVAVGGLKSFEDGLTGIIDGTESVSSAFKKMVTSIIADLARVVAEKAIFALLGLKEGGSVGGGKSVLGFADGGLPGFASGASPSVLGGIIRGPGTGRSDSILALVGGKKPIMISNGEGIVNERAVKAYWPAIDAMNRGTFPKLSDGGLVSPHLSMPKLPSAASISRAPAAPAGDGLHVKVSPSPYFDVAVTRIASPMAQAAVIGGARQAAEDRHDDAYSAIPQ